MSPRVWVWGCTVRGRALLRVRIRPWEAWLPANPSVPNSCSSIPSSQVGPVRRSGSGSCPGTAPNPRQNPQPLRLRRRRPGSTTPANARWRPLRYVRRATAASFRACSPASWEPSSSRSRSRSRARRATTCRPCRRPIPTPRPNHPPPSRRRRPASRLRARELASAGSQSETPSGTRSHSSAARALSIAPIHCRPRWSSPRGGVSGGASMRSTLASTGGSSGRSVQEVLATRRRP